MNRSNPFRYFNLGWEQDSCSQTALPTDLQYLFQFSNLLHSVIPCIQMKTFFHIMQQNMAGKSSRFVFPFYFHFYSCLMFVSFTDFTIYESHLLSQILLANYLFPLRLMLSQRATYQLPSSGLAHIQPDGAELGKWLTKSRQHAPFRQRPCWVKTIQPALVETVQPAIPPEAPYTGSGKDLLPEKVPWCVYGANSFARGSVINWTPGNTWSTVYG